MNERTKTHAYFVFHELRWNNCMGTKNKTGNNKAQARFSTFQPSKFPFKTFNGFVETWRNWTLFPVEMEITVRISSIFDYFAHFIRILQVSSKWRRIGYSILKFDKNLSQNHSFRSTALRILLNGKENLTLFFMLFSILIDL